MASLRVQREWKVAVREGLPIAVLGSDTRVCHSFLIGPAGTPFEDGVYAFRFHYTSGYPMDPPEITFETRIYHPNIDTRGQVSVDILQDNWSPALTFISVYYSLECLLSDPNFDCPLNPEVGLMFKRDPEEYWRVAKEWTRRYAC